MLNNPHFYHRSIRKIVVAFGTLFNDIQVVRFTKDGATAKEIFKVPLSYGPKEKYITRLESDPNLTKSVNVVVPRISFELTGMEYDPERKRLTASQNFSQATGTTLNTQYNPVPYNFHFTVSIYVRNTEDGTQIVEQILPFFTPDYTVTVDMIPNMSQKYDLPIILNTVNNETTYEGDFMDTRLIIWTLTFTAKGYIFPPVKQSGLITSANVNMIVPSSLSGVGTGVLLNIINTGLYKPQSGFSEQQVVYVDYANGKNFFAENEIVRLEDRNVSGIVRYFSNNSTGSLIIEDIDGLIKAGDVLLGDTSLSRYTVTDTVIKASDLVTIRTTIVPPGAGPDDEYGFSEEIIENV